MNNGPALTHRSAASAWPRGRPQASAQERIPLRWRVLGGAQSLLFCFWLTAQALPWVPFPSSLSTFAATSSARGLELFTALPRPIPVTVLTGLFSPPLLHSCAGQGACAHLLSFPRPPWPSRNVSSLLPSLWWKSCPTAFR